MKTLFKVFTVLAACVLTWLATSSILAQQRGTRGLSVLVDNKVVTKSTDQSPLTPAEAAASLGMAQITRYNVTVVENKATVTLNSLLVDHRPGISYIWRLRVVDADYNTLSEAWYDHQIFQLDATGSAEPTFNEVFDLPAGAKRVTVTLYELSKGIDMIAFKQTDMKDRSTVIRGVATVNP